MEVTKFPLLEKLYLNNNKLSVLPPEICRLKNLKVLRADDNVLVSVPGKCYICTVLINMHINNLIVLSAKAVRKFESCNCLLIFLILWLLLMTHSCDFMDFNCS